MMNNPTSSIYTQTDAWIDDFQQKLCLPVAQQVAEFCRDKNPDSKGKPHPLPLLRLDQFLRTSNEERAKANALAVVLGPFGVRRDNQYTYWQGVKVMVGNHTVAAVLCRLNNKGNGGFYNVKLWDMDVQKYRYHGDPAQERQIHPRGVIKMITDHMAIQYHVGFVEDDRLSMRDRKVINSRQDMLENDDERRIRESYEKAAKQAFGD